jgi:hypothetical protein
VSSQILHLLNGQDVTIDHCPGYATNIETEGLIIGSLWGFNDLGGWYARTLPDLLGIQPKSLRNWIENPLNLPNRLIQVGLTNDQKEQIFITLIPSRRPDSTLKAAAFVPTSACEAYKKLVLSYGKPYRDFYYAVIFEALNQLADAGCSTISIAGITSIDDPYLLEINNCVAEAVAHYALKSQGISRVVTIGEGPDITYGINFFNNNPEKLGNHREIQSKLIVNDDISVLTIELPHC